MKRAFLLIIALCLQVTMSAQQHVGDITEHIGKFRMYNRRRKYPDHKTVINPRLPFNNSITPQGMAVYNGKIYQFRNGGYCQVMDIKSMRQTESFYIPMSEAPTGSNAMHMGAVAFSQEYSDEPGYTEDEGGLPYLYVMMGDDVRINGERYGTVAVFDINHNYNMLNDSIYGYSQKIRTCRLVRYFRLKQGGDITTNFIAAFDFSKGKGWIFGYNEKKKNKAMPKQLADFLVREFHFQQQGSGDITSSVSYNGSGFMVQTRCGNLQDCTFKEGKVYLSLGGSASKKCPMNAHIAVYDPESRSIVSKTDMLTQHESEGIDILDNTIYQTFYIKRSEIRILKYDMDDTSKHPL